ncbi:MAG: hypothetical protein V9H69_28005 [Anaerolineae bacterium]
MRISRDIQRRHKPLLVDVGGRPTAGTGNDVRPLHPRRAADARRRSAGGMAGAAGRTAPAHPGRPDAPIWRGENRLDAAAPTIQGVLAGLERHSQAQGPAFEALVDRLAQLFAASGEDLRQRHLASAPAEIDRVDLDRLARTLGVPLREQKPYWAPEHIPLLLDYLPAATPLAIYGRGVAWVIAALARLAHPARFFSFDVRLGWVEARPLRIGSADAASPVRFVVDRPHDALRVSATLPEQYIDYDELDQVSRAAGARRRRRAVERQAAAVALCQPGADLSARALAGGLPSSPGRQRRGVFGRSSPAGGLCAARLIGRVGCIRERC